MSKLFSLVKTLLAEYPAVVTAGLAFAVTVLAKFGFHVSEDQLVAWSAVAYAAIAALVHGGFRAARKARKTN